MATISIIFNAMQTTNFKVKNIWGGNASPLNPPMHIVLDWYNINTKFKNDMAHFMTEIYKTCNIDVSSLNIKMISRDSLAL